MKRTTTIALALVLAVSMMAMPLAAADLGTAASAQDENNEDDDGVAPGEQLAGVVGVQEAELGGELSERTYGIRVAQAQTDDAKADVVSTQLSDVEDRITELEERTEELNESYESGEISQGQYESKMAAVAVEKQTAHRLANGTAATANEMENPEEHGINVSAIETLADRAAELGGPEVAKIAQSIAGDGVGQPIDADREPGAPIERPGADSETSTDDASGPDDAEENETDTEENDETDAEEEETVAEEEETDDDGANGAASDGDGNQSDDGTQ